jgi:hypothetical protein
MLAGDKPASAPTIGGRCRYSGSGAQRKIWSDEACFEQTPEV